MLVGVEGFVEDRDDLAVGPGQLDQAAPLGGLGLDSRSAQSRPGVQAAQDGRLPRHSGFADLDEVDLHHAREQGGGVLGRQAKLKPDHAAPQYTPVRMPPSEVPILGLYPPDSRGLYPPDSRGLSRGLDLPVTYRGKVYTLVGVTLGPSDPKVEIRLRGLAADTTWRYTTLAETAPFTWAPKDQRRWTLIWKEFHRIGHRRQAACAEKCEESWEREESWKTPWSSAMTALEIQNARADRRFQMDSGARSLRVEPAANRRFSLRWFSLRWQMGQPQVWSNALGGGINPMWWPVLAGWSKAELERATFLVQAAVQHPNLHRIELG